MRVLVTPEAEAQLDVRRKWWRDHREKAPDLFDEEFLAAMERIGRAPGSFPIHVQRRKPTLRRCLMPKSRCHLYFEIDEQAGVAWVIAAAGGQRRRPPRFRLQEALSDSV
jgi:hypothetical protein